MKGTLEKLQRHAFEWRAENITPLATALRDPARAEAGRNAANQVGQENAVKRRQQHI